MAIFGWCVLVLIALGGTLVGAAIIRFGGEEFSPAGRSTLLTILALICLVWYFLISNSPFTVSVG